MKNNKGFTLIEILIALTIFAILASITSSSLYYAFTTRAKVDMQADRLNELQLAMSILEQDTAQIVARAVRGNEMRLFPTLLGQSTYMEFTRDGVVNPESSEKRSTLQRVALVCHNNALIRRTWDSLDTIDRERHHDKTLIRFVNKCQFSYLSRTRQVLPEWREQTQTQGEHSEILPTALQINLTLKDWDKISVLFIIPEALYAAK